MKDVNEIHKLLSKQKKIMNSIITMQKRLFEVQSQIIECLSEHNIQTNKEESNQDILTLGQVCELFNVSKSTIHRMRKSNALPSQKVKGRRGVYFSKKEIEEYMKKHKQ